MATVGGGGVDGAARDAGADGGAGARLRARGPAPRAALEVQATETVVSGAARTGARVGPTSTRSTGRRRDPTRPCCTPRDRHRAAPGRGCTGRSSAPDRPGPGGRRGGRRGVPGAGLARRQLGPSPGDAGDPGDRRLPAWSPASCGAGWCSPMLGVALLAGALVLADRLGRSSCGRSRARVVAGALGTADRSTEPSSRIGPPGGTGLAEH